VKTAEQTVHDVRSGATTATEELETALGAIKARNDELNVFLYVDEEGARRQAQAVDDAISRGEDAGPLAGVPIALKDNL
jgi:Asp-tRNA(Asn)/Glu-tRNA(Gln) amidotransferase A subunit family amidase